MAELEADDAVAQWHTNCTELTEETFEGSILQCM